MTMLRTYLKDENRKLRIFRKELIKLALNLPQEFNKFCFDFHALDENKNYKDYQTYIYETFTSKNIILALMKFEYICDYLELNTKNLKTLFSSIFKTEEYTITAAEKIKNLIGIENSDYLFILRNIIDDNFPIIINKELSIQEKTFVKFLIYKGTETDFLKKYNIKSEKIQQLKTSLIQNFHVKTIEEVIQKILIEKYMRPINFAYLDGLVNMHLKDIINYYILTDIHQIPEPYTKLFEIKKLLDEKNNDEESLNIPNLLRFKDTTEHIQYLLEFKRIIEYIQKIT